MTTKKTGALGGSWKLEDDNKKNWSGARSAPGKKSGFLVHFQGNVHGMGLKMASKKNWWPYVMGRQTKDDIKKTGAEIHCFRKDDIVKLEDDIKRNWSGPRQFLANSWFSFRSLTVLSPYV